MADQPATKLTPDVPMNGMGHLRLNWFLIATMLALILTGTAAWHKMQTTIAIYSERTAIIERTVVDLPTDYVPREVIDARLASMEKDLQRQTADLQDIKRALGVR